MTIETIQKERLCELLPDYTEQLIADLEWIVEKLDEQSNGSPAYLDCIQVVLEIREALRQEGLPEEYINSRMPSQVFEATPLAA